MRILALVIILSALPFSLARAVDLPLPTASCIRAKVQGDASTYNPNYAGWMTGGQSLATGGKYNPNGWEAALQLDLAKKYGCGYGSGRTCQAVVESKETGKVVILLINDNGPLTAGRVIDLNEKSMQYLSNGKYGRNSGVLRGVTVTLLSCNFSNYLGPINATDREVWARDIDRTNVTDATPMYNNPGNPYSPMSVTPYTNTGANAGYGATPVSSLIGAQSSPLSLSNSSGSSASESTASGASSVVGTLSTSMIIIQPKSVRAGSAVLVSWTSVNMQPASCNVTRNGVEFAKGNEATKRDTVASGTEYVLECTTPTGETVVSKVSVVL